MSHILIFVDSDRPDAYLNSIVHNLRARPVQQITFVHVSDFQSLDASESDSGKASRSLASVRKLIERLANVGEYVFQDGRAEVLTDKNGLCTSEEVRTFYKAVERSPVSYSSVEIPYSRLRKYLRTFVRENDDCVLDVTGCRKRFLGDFVAIGLVDGFPSICSFDIVSPLDYSRPWKNLYHDLLRRPPSAFQYVNLLETRAYSECSRAVLVRSPRYRHAYVVAAAFILLGIALNYLFGLESAVAKWANVISQYATIVALLLIFFPPRDA